MEGNSNPQRPGMKRAMRPSGHLYEIPHVSKAAECVTAVLQISRAGRHGFTITDSDASAVRFCFWRRKYSGNSSLRASSRLAWTPTTST